VSIVARELPGRDPIRTLYSVLRHQLAILEQQAQEGPGLGSLAWTSEETAGGVPAELRIGGVGQGLEAADGSGDGRGTEGAGSREDEGVGRERWQCQQRRPGVEMEVLRGVPEGV